LSALDCFVCRKHRGEISIPGGAIYEDDLVYASHVQIPEGQATAYLGYLMVEPRRHAAGLADLTDAEAQAMGLMVARRTCTFTLCRATPARRASIGASAWTSGRKLHTVGRTRSPICVDGCVLT